MEPDYTATATSQRGGRAGGRVSTSDGLLQLDLSVPPELGGPGGEGTNPEQLFAAGYAACFHSALMAACRAAKQSTKDSTVTADVSLCMRDGGGYELAVALRIHLPKVDGEMARSLVETAHQKCPYSKAIQGNVEVEWNFEPPDQV